MKNRILVIYKSKTGFAEQYAQWISEELGADKVSYSDRNKINFENYDTVIFGGGVYAGAVGGLKWFKSKLPELKDKKIAVFATGSMPPGTDEVKKMLDQNFSEEERNNIKPFYLHGGLCYERIGFFSRLMMSAFRKMLKKADGDSEASQRVQQSFDCSSKEFAGPLLEYCRE